MDCADLLLNVVTALISAGIIGGIVCWANWRIIKQQQQHKSADLTFQIREYWSETKYPESAKFINNLYAKKVKADDPQTRKFLSHLEHVAILWKENAIIENHVKEFFWPDLKIVLENTPVKDRIYAKYEENHYTYANLVELLEKSKKWKT